MSRLKPLSPETTPELKSHFDFFLGTLGFTPNSVLTMQRKPHLVKAFAQLNAAVMTPYGEVDLGFRRLIGHLASKASGCIYCQAYWALRISVSLKRKWLPSGTMLTAPYTAPLRRLPSTLRWQRHRSPMR